MTMKYISFEKQKCRSNSLDANAILTDLSFENNNRKSLDSFLEKNNSLPQRKF